MYARAFFCIQQKLKTTLNLRIAKCKKQNQHSIAIAKMKKLAPKFANKKGGEEDARTKNQRNLQAL